jgi:hypothetical protein
MVYTSSKYHVSIERASVHFEKKKEIHVSIQCHNAKTKQWKHNFTPHSELNVN